MRPRLRRLLFVLQRPSAPAAGPNHANAAETSPTQDDAGSHEAERRLEDAQRRLKRAVPPRED
jgi:hypothetical protein